MFRLIGATFRLLTPLQASSIVCFVPCITTAFAKGEAFVCAAVTLVLATSVVVHRNGRQEVLDMFDRIDCAAVLLWIIACNAKFTDTNRPMGAREAIAIAAAAGVIWLDAKRIRAGKWQSRERTRLHALMHACGALCTLCLVA